jgi:hypothetical protein
MNTSAKLMAQLNSTVSSTLNTASSDTDGELFSRKGGHPDKYVTESGTDDDVILLGTHTAATFVGKDMNKSNRFVLFLHDNSCVVVP